MPQASNQLLVKCYHDSAAQEEVEEDDEPDRPSTLRRFETGSSEALFQRSTPLDH